MVLSLAVYGLTALMLFVCGRRALLVEQRLVAAGADRLPRFNIWVTMAVLTFTAVAAMRFHTGFDHAMYLEQYITLIDLGSFTRDNFEPLFVWVSRAFAACGAHYVLYFAFWAALQAALLYWGLADRKHLLPWLGPVIMFTPLFIHLMNTMRQGVIECAVVASVVLLRDKRRLLWLLFVLVSMTLHKGAIVLVLLLLLPYRRVASCPRWVTVGIYLGCVLLGLWPVWFKVFTPMFDWLHTLGYRLYEGFAIGVVNDGLQWSVPGPLRLLLIASHLVVLCYYPQVRRHFSRDTLLPVCFAIAFTGMCLMLMMANVSHFFLRPVEYLTIFVPVMLAYTMSYLWQTRRLWHLALVLSVSCSYVVAALYKAVLVPDPLNTQFVYQFFFMQ